MLLDIPTQPSSVLRGLFTLSHIYIFLRFVCLSDEKHSAHKRLLFGFKAAFRVLKSPKRLLKMRLKELAAHWVLYCLCGSSFEQTLLREPPDEDLVGDSNSSYAINGTTNTTRWTPWYQEFVVYRGKISVHFSRVSFRFLSGEPQPILSGAKRLFDYFNNRKPIIPLTEKHPLVDVSMVIFIYNVQHLVCEVVFHTLAFVLFRILTIRPCN